MRQKNATEEMRLLERAIAIFAAEVGMTEHWVELYYYRRLPQVDSLRSRIVIAGVRCAKRELEMRDRLEALTEATMQRADDCSSSI